ncbi:RIB43A-like with coiled-coils protein 1 [Gracilinanus agilis]|uniref:RIB43A-like with coiled-coils protein 1 n=1 Tax=Gracilinanus agilis TaxID=191870 RepID=UPI001CFD5D8B|nr:RIB43A-like with coiled-coils protein 1 [Gracilinanus agilis]
MYKVDIQPEQKEAVAIEARRNREKQRQSRIFNVRNRVIGVDTEGLKSQVQERRQRENAEQAREAALDASRVQCDLVAQMLEKEESQRARQVAKQVQAFREREQQPQDSRDFDLYYSARPQKENPVRAGDPDARCGPSSMQYFAGEDLGHPSHQRLQREQNRRELNRQREEQRQAKRDERYSELLADKKRVEMDLRAIHLEALEAACREAMDMAMANYNRAQAIEVEKQQRLARQREQDDNLTEIYNHLTSDLLTESTSASSSTLASQKVSGGWKGMSPEQVAAIHKEQAAQRLEAQHRRQTEQRLEAEWAFQEKLVAQAVCQLDRAQKVKTQKLRQGLDAYNKQLAQEQQAQ